MIKEYAENIYFTTKECDSILAFENKLRHTLMKKCFANGVAKAKYITIRTQVWEPTSGIHPMPYSADDFEEIIMTLIYKYKWNVKIIKAFKKEYLTIKLEALDEYIKLPNPIHEQLNALKAKLEPMLDGYTITRKGSKLEITID